MKTLFIFITIQLIVSHVNAQKMYDVQFSNCPLKFILEDNETFINYEPNDSLLVVDFLVGIESKQADKLMGTVMMQIMVDTTNQICCVSYTNKTTMNDNKLDIPNRLMNLKGLKRMPNAIPEENICALVSIIFDKNEITVIRNGYNRNTGRKIMKSTIYKRHADNGSIENINK